MPSRVVFIDTLRPDSELRKQIESYAVLIAGQWTKADVCNELFGYAEQDYYQWVSSGGKHTPQLEEFLGATLDWIDTLALEDGFVIGEVIKDVAHSYLDHVNPRHKDLSFAEASSDVRQWINRLVLGAINHHE